MRDNQQGRDSGFTLIELLIVIVILGVLATVVVFAVGGITDQASVSAGAADETTLAVAQEAHMAQFGSYSDEPGLVAAGLLRDESELFDITLTASSYTITPAGGGGGGSPLPAADPAPDPTPTTTAPPAGPVAASYATATKTFSGQSIGTGSKTLVIIGGGTGSALWTTLQAAQPANTSVVWLGAADITTAADIDEIVTSGADYIVAASSIPIKDGPVNTYVGAYMNSNYPASTFWWTFGQGGNPTLAQLEAALA